MSRSGADLEYLLRAVERFGPDEPGSAATLHDAVVALLLRAIEADTTAETRERIADAQREARARS